MTLQEIFDLVVFLEKYKNVQKLESAISTLQTQAMSVADELINNKSSLTAHEIALLDGGRGKLQTIKAHRTRTNIGLVESKKAVEDYMLANYGGKYWDEERGVCFTNY